MSRTLGEPAGLDADQQRVLTTMLAMQRHSWEQGLAAHALLDLGRHDLVRAMARDAVTRQTAAGQLAELGGHAVVNSAANGEAVRWAAADTGDPGLARALDRQLEWICRTAPRAADGTVFHLEDTRETWADTVYMVVPLLALTGDVDGAAAQLAGHRSRLHDEAAGLYRARWDEEHGRFSHAGFWGTGNGWVVAGVARALHHLAATGREHDAFRAGAAAHARRVVDACLAHRTPSGLFHDVVDDPATFEEVNLGQMLAYATLTGVADGWLPEGYAAVGRDLIATARAHVDPDGFVTPVCGAPHFDRPGTSVEAQAMFLLATAAEARLAEPVGGDPGGR